MESKTLQAILDNARFLVLVALVAAWGWTVNSNVVGLYTHQIPVDVRVEVVETPERVAESMEGLIHEALQVHPLAEKADKVLCPKGDCKGDCGCSVCKGKCSKKIEAAADLDISIDGPQTASAGNLVRLKAVGDYAILRWRVVPASDNFEVVDGGKRAFFCSPVGGTYTFLLFGSDGKDAATAELVLTIEGGPSPPPGPGPGPTPKPVVSLKALATKWLASVNSPNKAAEAQALATAYEAIAAQVSAGALTKPDDIIAAIGAKTRETLGLLALPHWMPVLEPLRAELNEREKTGPLKYDEILRDLAAALREVKPPAVVPVAPQPAKAAPARTPNSRTQAQRAA